MIDLLLRRTIAACLLVLSSACATAGQEKGEDALRAAFEPLAVQFVGEGRADGISIAIVHQGSVRYASAGQASRESSTRVTPDTVFEVGSLSKLFAGLLLAQAVEEGRTKLDDDVRLHLSGQYPNLEWQGEPVRLGQLADTSSGLPDYLPDPSPIAHLPPPELQRAASQLLRSYGDAAFLRDLRDVRLLRRPGESTSHSNVAAQLLGLVLGRLYQRPFAELLRDRIERPYGMQHGGSNGRPDRMASGYDGEGVRMPPFEGQSILPAGGLRYSARDMARFLAAQLRSDDPAIRLSHEVRIRQGDDAVGLGWVVSRSANGEVRLRMSGGTFGFSSYVEIYPSLGYGIVLMANRAGGHTQDQLQAIAEQGLASFRAPS